MTTTDLQLGRTDLVQHSIHLMDETPVAQRSYRKSPHEQQVEAEHVEWMLEVGLIEPPDSP